MTNKRIASCLIRKMREQVEREMMTGVRMKAKTKVYKRSPKKKMVKKKIMRRKNKKRKEINTKEREKTTPGLDKTNSYGKNSMISNTELGNWNMS